MSLLAPHHPLTRFVCCGCGSSQLSLRESAGAAALEPPRAVSISVHDCICCPHWHKPQILRRCTEDGSEELTVPQKSRRGTPSSMVRRSSRSVMAAQWGTGKMPGGGVKVDRSCTARQRQPECHRHNQNPTLLSLSLITGTEPTPTSCGPFCGGAADAFTKPTLPSACCGHGIAPLLGLPMAGAASALATGLPLMLAAEHHAVRMGVWLQAKRVCRCALGTESGRRLQSSHGCCLPLASRRTAAILARGRRLLWATRCTSSRWPLTESTA